MKLLIFSCLVALALARPEALSYINRHIKLRDLENRLNEDVIPVNQVSSSEESLQQLDKVRTLPENYELNKPREVLKSSSSEESVTPATEERVRRQVEYNLNREDTFAPAERKIEDVSEQYQHYQRFQEERPLNLQYMEYLYNPYEARYINLIYKL
ncbi:alpha-S1-casein [Macrotis lagotis]|uniref:alpha-S1-casein n=1 Tax=Macrotis lagotis TaxID=92651 RepID=UPI003D69CE06